MKRSRVRSLTTLASATLLMTLLGSPAQALPWQFATEGWRAAAGWIETIRSWITPEKEPPSPGTSRNQTTMAAKSTNGKDKEVTPAGDDGVCLDPGGNRIPCSN